MKSPPILLLNKKPLKYIVTNKDEPRKMFAMESTDPESEIDDEEFYTSER